MAMELPQAAATLNQRSPARRFATRKGNGVARGREAPSRPTFKGKERQSNLLKLSDNALPPLGRALKKSPFFMTKTENAYDL